MLCPAQWTPRAVFVCATLPAAVLETIPDGSQIEVSGITESGWYQVSFQDTQGYVSTDYVVLSETVELPTVAEPVYGKVTEGPLNVRSAPSTDSEKVDSFSTGKVLTILENRDVRGVLDIGGDPVGARVLARFRPKILQEDHQLVYVLNANRPEVREPENAIAYLRAIEATCGVPMTGLVNNTHLCGETTVEEILKGARLVREVSERTGLPVVCHVVVKALCGDKMLAGLPLFPIDIYMKKPWE